MRGLDPRIQEPRTENGRQSYAEQIDGAWMRESSPRMTRIPP
jgi:hypothetical protein